MMARSFQTRRRDSSGPRLCRPVTTSQCTSAPAPRQWTDAGPRANIMPDPSATLRSSGAACPMSDDDTRSRTKVLPKTEQPRLHKVILINDDYTPRDFVVTVLKAEFRMTEGQAHRVMVTA